MAITDSTYFNFTRIREVGPEARDWAAVDKDWETVGLILKQFENHHHDGSVTLPSPAFYTAPVAPTVANVGAAGVVTYSYYVVAKGPTLVPDRISAVGTTNTGNATLDGTNYNTITWAAVTGATSYDVIRVTGGATQGKLTNTVSTSYNDQGAAATTYTPSRQPVLTESTTGGILPPGANVGVRLSYVNALGLETDACPENAITLSSTVSRPLTPALVSTAITASAIAGGTYLYVLTKQKGTGETVISDPLAVTIPYDNTYSVTISFDPLSSYTDGTTAINIYRTTGLASTFTRVGQITASGTTSYTDNNSVNVDAQPPTTNTFDAARKVNISWAALTHPTSAARLRVYVTQQPGIYGTNCLLNDIDLTASPPTSIDYLGSETLQSGWPSNSTEIPASPPKLNLGTEAVGAPILTADMDFAGFKAKNMSVNFVPSVPTDGMFWYDSSTTKFRGKAGGTVADFSSPAVLVNGILDPDATSGTTSWFSRLDTFTGSPAITPTNITTDGAPVSTTQTALNDVITSSGATVAQVTVATFNMSGTAAQIKSTAAQCTAGQVISGSMWTNIQAGSSGLDATTRLTLIFRFYDSSGNLLPTFDFPAGGTGSTGLLQTSAMTAGTWYRIFGTATAPANAAYVGLYVAINKNGAASTFLTGVSSTVTFRFDAAVLVADVGSTTNFITYFDGNFPGSYWKGTANLSQSVKGGFQHSVNEIGGHDSANIILGTSNVNAFLTTRYATAAGAHQQVITPGYAVGTTSGPTTVSTTPADVPEMSVSTGNAQINGQYFEATFQGAFVLANNGMTANFAIEVNGTVVEESKRAITAVVDNQAVSVNIQHTGTITTAGTAATVKGKWWVSSGTLTATTVRRSTKAKLEL